MQPTEHCLARSRSHQDYDETLALASIRSTIEAALSTSRSCHTRDAEPFQASRPGFLRTTGAHPVEPHRIDDHFSIIVPFARSISPITKTDWEGTGVEPDIRVPAGDALEE